MKINGSTQHLISYYSVEDVRAHRLRTPSSLPEFAGLQISPIFLNPVNFREPPHTEIGPDGGLRYVSDKPQSSRTSGHGSSSEGTSGSDTRTGGGRGVRVALNQSGRASPTALFTSASPSTTTNSSPNLDAKRSDGALRLPHQIGGSGAIPSEATSAALPRRMSDGPLRGRHGSGGGRYEPYPHPAAVFNQGVPVIPSRSSRPATPAGSPYEAASPPTFRGERAARNLSHHASLGSHLNLNVWQQPQSEGNSPFYPPGMTHYSGSAEIPIAGGSARGAVVAAANPNYDSSWSDTRIPLLPPASINQAPSHGSTSASSSSAGSENRHNHRHEHSGSSSSHSSIYGSHLQQQQHQHQQAGLSPALGSDRSQFLPAGMQNLDSRSPWEVAAGGHGQSFAYENALQGSNSFQYVNSDRYPYGDALNPASSNVNEVNRGLDLNLWPQQHQQQQQQQRSRAQSTSVISAFNNASNDSNNSQIYLSNFNENPSQRPQGREG